MRNILFIAINNIGSGLSGGDRIFLELARNWATYKNTHITILSSQETVNLLKRYKIEVDYINIDSLDSSPIIIHQIRRLFLFCKYFLKNKHLFSKYNFIYTVSDFPPDFLAGLVIKLFNHHSTLISGFYLFAPYPFSNNSPYFKSHLVLKNIIYYYFQKIIYSLGRIHSNIIYITSSPDQAKFLHKKTVIIRGGVPDEYLSKKQIKYRKIFDAVFIGRLHPQKGTLELIDIWKKVVRQSPKSKLAIIGDGELKIQLQSKIKKNKLSKNIKLFGFLDNDVKLKIFNQSKIVVHPATYDSGGMAAAEAMSQGLPAISFDLEALKTYYPQGMIKVPINDIDNFSDTILNLINDQELYREISREALQLIKTKWLWSKQAKTIYDETFSKR